MTSKFFEVHHGSTRTVLLIGKYAIKIPCVKAWDKFLKGMIANLTERRISKSAPKYFVPVLWSSRTGLIVVMPRCKVVNIPNWMLRSFMADLFHESVDEGDEEWTARRYCEYIAPNYGMYKGKPMCIDYGTFMPIAATREDIKREYDLMDWDLTERYKLSPIS